MEKHGNLLLLAKDELEAENYSEADRLVNDSLAIERNNLEAWLIKAKLAYFHDRGLQACYKYLENASECRKDDTDVDKIANVFYELSLKELKWVLDKQLGSLYGIKETLPYHDLIDTFILGGTKLTISLNRHEMFGKVITDFKRYAITEIKDKWSEVARDYYQNDVSNYGRSWEVSTLYENDYRPTESALSSFVDGCVSLGCIIYYTSSLYFDEVKTIDENINLLKLGIEILNLCSKAKAYEVYYDEDDTYDEYGSHYWRASVVLGDNDKKIITTNKAMMEESILKFTNKKKTLLGQKS